MAPPRKRRTSRPMSAASPDDAGARFDPSKLDRSVIAIPLLDAFDEEESARKAARTAGETREPRLYTLVIDCNLDHEDGREAARMKIVREICKLTDEPPPEDLVALREEPQGRERRSGPRLARAKTGVSRQYVFAYLTREHVLALVAWDVRKVRPEDSFTVGRARRVIYRVWPDFEIQAQLTKSLRTVKADAALKAFSASGEGVVWAVLDSGVSKKHVHFVKHKNLELKDALEDKHRDFVGGGDALDDPFGHGTHVAGIIAGEYALASDPESATRTARLAWRELKEKDEVKTEFDEVREISGVAPKTKILSLRVLDEAGRGLASNLIVALEYVQDQNEHGRRLRIHGVNMSVGYEFDPEWFACGHSPLCTEVNRLVRSGVVVVAAAGNTGYGYVQTNTQEVRTAGLDLTINDPGNADLAITVGSTHREEPHTYGVSYFSSKGPTGDGRLKPDLVAPGERVLSCGAGAKRPDAGADREAPPNKDVHYYVEMSGTSMAAPHVSGVIAAFLSIRREFMGEPERVKQIFLDSATDLHRDRYFQGRGLVDLMRAIQSV